MQRCLHPVFSTKSTGKRGSKLPAVRVGISIFNIAHEGAVRNAQGDRPGKDQLVARHLGNTSQRVSSDGHAHEQRKPGRYAESDRAKRSESERFGQSRSHAGGQYRDAGRARSSKTGGLCGRRGNGTCQNHTPRRRPGRRKRRRRRSAYGAEPAVETQPCRRKPFTPSHSNWARTCRSS